MPRATPKVHAKRGLTFDERAELEFGPNHNTGSVFADDAERRAFWKKYRGAIMANWCAGMRPVFWWLYEYGSPPPCGWGRPRQEPALLRALHLLEPGELKACEARWREYFDEAQYDRFTYFDGEAWSEGTAAKRAHYEHHGIPDDLVQAWTPPAA